MSGIRAKDTKPEMQVRRILHSSGYRFRLHVKGLPGTPDLVFPGRRKVVHVNGCFWHLHDCKKGSVRPQVNAAFWENKRLATKERDDRNRAELEALGWTVMTVWECQLKDPLRTRDELVRFLSDG